MNFNLITNIEICYNLVKDVPLALVYYSHIPAAIIAIFIGIFVLLKNRSLASKLLFSIAFVFSLWSFIDLLLWTSYDSRVYMFFWAIEFILEILLFVISLYFVYAFINKKDVSLTLKLIWGFLVAPIIILTGSRYTLTNFDMIQCIPTEGPLWESYMFPLELIFAIWIIIYSILKYRKSQKEEKIQIIFLMIGICLFLGTFSLAGYVVNLTGFNYEYELFGLIGLPIFIAFLAYLIVRYRAFNIKLIAAQALMVSLVILIGSQFFFIQNPTNKILNGITLALAVGFGYMLVKSVKMEVKQKEALEVANKKIKEKSDELEAANEKLKQLDRAKTDFINFASHQLRTPITSIRGFSSLLAEGSYGELAPQQKETVKKVEIVAGRMASLVEDFLSASRIDSGTMKYEFDNCRIEDICQEVVTTLFPKANGKKLYLKYEKPKTALPELLIDGSKTRETISNLVDNAIKYTEKGGVTVSVELAENNRLKTDDKRVARIIVSDTGIGIPKEELAHLFMKFSRGLDIKRLTATGTGLGLFVGRSMIEKQGGKIWAESGGEGQGSRFIVELPVKQSRK